MLPPRRLRQTAALLLAVLLLPSLFLRDRGLRWDHHRRVGLTELQVAPEARAGLGPFRLLGAWQFASADYLFGGYSALVPRPGNRLLAISDRGGRLEFAEPQPGRLPAIAPYRMERTTRDKADGSGPSDAESATTGPSGEVWVAWEDRRLISHFSPDLSREARVAPRAMRHWSAQFGAESLARTVDGRFIVISEDYLPRLYERKHETLLFPSDPTRARGGHPVEPLHGRLTGLEGYRPTDMALLPDGRALILFRQLIWPLPMRFSCRIAVADPAELARTGEWSVRELARLDPPLPSDNYEALAIRPRSDGHVDVWVMSDDNRASTQRTLLLKLELDPALLPRPSRQPISHAASRLPQDERK